MAFKILEDGNAVANAVFGFAHVLQHLLVIGQCAMREVKPKDAHALADHLLQRFLMGAGGPDSRDNSCACSHAGRSMVLVVHAREQLGVW